MIGLRLYPSGGAGTSSFTITLTPDTVDDDELFPTHATGSSTAAASGGTAPYTYSWALLTGSAANVSVTGTATATVSFELAIVALRTFVYRVTATDANGATSVADLSVLLQVI